MTSSFLVLVSLGSFLFVNVSSFSPLPSDSDFFLSKTSPLTETDTITYAKYAADNSLSTHLHSFCSSAKLFCFPRLAKVGEHLDGYEYSAKISYGSINGNHKPKSVSLGTFFRESMLKHGTIMLMSDLRDYTPKRSFLPPTIVSKLPFSTSKIEEVKQIFHAENNSIMENIIKNALSRCESDPPVEEQTSCVFSVEGMIDFASLVLGRNVTLGTTENVNGSRENILIGSVSAINGGGVTKTVSCHPKLYPYLVYYCHSALKSRVYEMDILDRTSKAKINHGVAICHLDTKTWSPKHEAFRILKTKPGRTEVCHWVSENDVLWV